MSEVYEIIKNIGGGSFGQVYLVRHKREEKQYVIKKIKTRDMSQKDRENTENEVRLLQKLRHTNIVAYKDSYLDREQYLNIVMVYCEGGDIYQKIKQCKGKHFPENQILDWMAQMALALYYLHDKKILHRDLKTQNIFLKNGRVRLGDFGIAKMLDSTRDFANTCIGTPYYMSPELFKYKPYSYKSDIWAFGCCVYEMCNLRHAFDAQSLNGLAVKIMKGSFPPITTTYSKSLRDLIGKMISINPKNRPTIWELINKPILKRRIITYAQELFSGKYPEANNSMDVDDVYLDSLREQGEKLGIMAQIEKQLQNPSLDPNDPIIQAKTNAQLQREKEAADRVAVKKKELWKELREKRKIEEEIKKLEKKKQIQEIKRKQNIEDQKQQQQRINQRKSVSQAVNNTDRQNHRKGNSERSQEKYQQNQVQQQNQNQNQSQYGAGGGSNSSKRSYSYEKKRDSSINGKQKQKQQQQSQKQSQPKLPPSSQVSTNVDSQNDLESKFSELSVNNSNINNSNNNQNILDDNSKREQILFKKQQKKKEEQQQWEQQFQQIQQENAQMRQQAAKKQQAQYRPSTGMRDVIGEEILQQNNDNNNIEENIENYNTNNNLDHDHTEQQQYKYQEEESEAMYNIQQQQSQNSQSIPVNSSSSVQQQNSNSSNIMQQNKQQDRPRELKIEEDYGMDDYEYYEDEEEEDKEDEQVIQEVENEDSDHEENVNQQQLDTKIEQMRTKLIHKTQKITELQQSMKPTTPLVQQDQLQETSMNQIEESQEIHQEEDEEIDFDIEENEDDYNEEEGELPQEAKLNQNPQYQKINDRVKLLRHRCEAGLGNVIFQQAYEFLKNCGNQRVDNVRKEMMKVLGEDMIGFWHLIDQVLVLENILTTVPQYVNV